MDVTKQNKLLLPLDGSERSLNTVRYIAGTQPFHQAQIVLFHVFSAVPESYWDLESDLRSARIIKHARAWEQSQKRIVQRYLNSARDILVKAGVPAQSIQLKIHKRKNGIARDIIREARDGYTAVVIRRRGLTALRGVVLGSVAAKLIENTVFVPVLVAGKTARSNRILIGFDGSPDALKAVKFTGAILGGYTYDTELLYVIRSSKIGFPEMESDLKSRAHAREGNDRMTASLYSAAKQLVSAGFASEAIKTKVVKGKISRAKAIADEARANNFGTIVVGRKGRSQVRDFFMGRVTNKVIHLARDRSIWII